MIRLLSRNAVREVSAYSIHSAAARSRAAAVLLYRSRFAVPSADDAGMDPFSNASQGEAATGIFVFLAPE
jgi:hypothetical protein